MAPSPFCGTVQWGGHAFGHTRTQQVTCPSVMWHTHHCVLRGYPIFEKGQQLRARCGAQQRLMGGHPDFRTVSNSAPGVAHGGTWSGGGGAPCTATKRLHPDAKHPECRQIKRNATHGCPRHDTLHQKW